MRSLLLFALFMSILVRAFSFFRADAFFFFFCLSIRCPFSFTYEFSDEPESDSISSASDFIAMHSGSHLRSVDDVSAELSPTLSPTRTAIVDRLAASAAGASANLTPPLIASDAPALSSRLSPEVVVDVAEAVPAPPRK